MSGCKLRGINKGAEVINSTRTYTYDASGNRLSKQAGTATALAYTYPSGPTPPTSHQLLAVGTVARGYDAMGNTTSIGGAAQGFTFDDTERMTQVKAAGAVTKTYQYNALGQRVRKSHAAITSEIQKTIYDETGHPLADIDYNNNLIDEYVWMDDLPIAILSGSTSVLEYIEPDHLGTPRIAIDAATNAQSWSWPLVNDPFGETQPTGTLTLNLRFPGQTYDAESGMNYNYFRDYDSNTGRYIESDPIGLRGGISTYAYVGGNPVNLIDPTGLVHWNGVYNFTSGGLSKSGVGGGATGYTFVLKSDCVNGIRVAVVVDALAGGGGAGASIFGPISIGASTVSFDDHLSTIDPTIFDGAFSVQNLGTIFASVTEFRMGGAIGDGSGWNISTSIVDSSAARGESHLRKIGNVQRCDCDSGK